MLVSKKPGGPNAKPGRPNTKPGKPKVRWNILRVGSPHVGACVSHVDLMLFVFISLALSSQRNCNFPVEYGLKNMDIRI